MAKKIPREPKPGEPVSELLPDRPSLKSTLAPLVTATVHPSSILRAPDDESRREEMRRFVADLKRVAAKL